MKNSPQNDNINDYISEFYPSKLRSPDISLVLPRERLYKYLDGCKNISFVIIHADPGYGKTTLISSYLSDRKRKAIWYHFGTTDRIPGIFISHISHAIFESFSEGFQEEKNMDSFNDVSDPEMAGLKLAKLLNRAREDLTLVFEDYHRVEENSDIHKTIITMLEHLSPGVQIIILSRVKPPLPLTKLLMAQRVRVLTKDDLKFTPEETEMLFSDIYNCSLNPGELGIVTRRLEGWVTGLRLTFEALMAAKKQNWTRFWLHFSDSAELFDFLTEEVLSDLSDESISFLYKTSIFSVLDIDVLSKFLPESNSVAILEMLTRKNLLTVKINYYENGYRYHDIFRQYLHKCLLKFEGEDIARDLHTRAADVYNQLGKIDLAIGHYLAAGKYQNVSPLIQRLANQHKSNVLLDLIEGRLERAFPEMECMYGAALRRFIPMEVYKQLMPGLIDIANDNSDDIDKIAQAHVRQRLGAYYYYLGDSEECIKWLKLSREYFYLMGLLNPASYSSTLIGLAYLFKGNPEQAEDFIYEALEFSEGNEGAHATMNALFAKAELMLAYNSFKEAEEAARMALSFCVHDPIGNPFYYGSLALALLNQGDSENALEMCNEALLSAQKFSVPYELGFAYLRMSTVLKEKGDIDQAWEFIEKAISSLKDYGFLFARATLLMSELAYIANKPNVSKLWNEAKKYWLNNGYQINPKYEGLIAPNILSEKKFKDNRTTLSKVEEYMPSPNNSASLFIRTFGKFQLLIQGRYSDPNRWGRDPARRLFFYFLINRDKKLDKDQVIEALWPNCDPYACNKRFWVALHVLRKELTPFSEVIIYKGKKYQLVLPEDAYLDLEHYLNFSKDGIVKKDKELMEKALEIYHGEFLEEYVYDDFLDEERERLREIQKRLLTTLADTFYQDGNMEKALKFYRELQKTDPYLEDPVSKIMIISTNQGEYGLAVGAYKSLTNNLEKELGIKPSNEITQLYKKIIENKK